MSHDKRQIETVDYARSMLGELRAMTRRDGFEFLSYLIEMAHLEATEIARTGKALGSGVDKRDATA